MSKVVKTVFGGSDKNAQRAQKSANNKAIDLIAKNTEQSREDILKLGPSAEVNRNLGFQAALDVLGQTIPQRFDTLQQGNVGAQQALLAGLPQIQAAILGQPVDLSGLQPQAINVDTSFAQQQLPEFGTIGQALAGPTAPQQTGIDQVQSNADLFRLASTGGIPGVGQDDQAFFARALANMLAKGGADATGNRFAADPLGQIPGFLGVEGGLTPQREVSFQNLLTQFAGLQ